MTSVFCKVCRLQGNYRGASWSTPKGLQKVHFLAHAGGKSHQLAMKDPDMKFALHSPPIGDFEEALRLVRTGKANGSQGTGNLKCDKLKKAKFCLAEALRCQSRLKIQACNCLTLHSDASKGYLLVRAQGCTDALEAVHTVIGIQKMVEFDAHGIVECILTMLSDFCSPFKFADTLNAREVDGLADLDKDLFKHLLQIVEVFNADAAADEQLAAD